MPTSYSLTPATTSASEGVGTITFTVTRSGDLPAETIFASTTTNQGSSNAGDYAGLLNQSVTFSAGQATRTFTVSITNDATVESNETFGVIIQRNSSDPITTFLDSSTFTIQDNDTVATTYSLTPASTTVDESAGTITYTVTRSGGLPAETIFASTTTNQGSSNASDYTGLLNQAITFSAGQTSRTFTVSISNDTAVESNETFGVVIQRNSSDPITTFLDSSTFTIQDNDTVATSYSLTPASTTVDEAAGTITFTVTRSGGLPAETIFASTTTNQGSSNASDYGGLLNQAITFSAGQTSRTFTIAITNDTSVEANETFGVVIQRNSSDPITTFLDSSTFTIQDNDAVGTTYALTPASTSVDEAAGTITFTVTRSGDLPAETIFASTTTNQGSSNSNDYTGLLNQGIAFNAGQSTQTFTVSVMNDSNVESNETFGVVIQRNATDPITTFLDSSTFTIQDNDAQGPTWSISPVSPQISESAGTVTFTVTRSSSVGAQTVYVSTTRDQGSSNASDYVGLNNVQLNFANGQTSATVTIQITNDALAEASETFGVIVQASATDPISTHLTSTTFTIGDDDGAGASWGISSPSPTVSEGAGTVTFTITRSDAGAAQSVYVSTVQNQGYSNQGDYSGLSNAPVSFAVGQHSATVTVSILNDNHPESGEQFSIIVQTSPSQPISTYLTTSTFTISDNDGNANAPPHISGQTHLSLSPNQTIAASSLFQASDVDGTIATVRFWDSTPGTAGYFTLDGAQIAGSFVDVTPADLARVGYFAGSSEGANTIVIEVFDNAGQTSGGLTITTETTQVAQPDGFVPVDASGLDEVDAALLAEFNNLARDILSTTLSVLARVDVSFDAAADFAAVDRARWLLSPTSAANFQNAQGAGAALWSNLQLGGNIAAGLEVITAVFSAWSAGWQEAVNGDGDPEDAIYAFSRELAIASGSAAIGTMAVGGAVVACSLITVGPAVVIVAAVGTGVAVAYGATWVLEQLLPGDLDLLMGALGLSSPSNSGVLAAPQSPAFSFDFDTSTFVSLSESNLTLWQETANRLGLDADGAVASDQQLSGDFGGLAVDDLLIGGNGNDTIAGGGGADIASGGDGADNLSGGLAADYLIGGRGDDVLDGGLGADTMEGGAGDDVYIVDNAGDVIVEASASGGADTVRSSITRTLGANLENLILTGVGAITGNGNALNNVITGNSAANTLFGFDGNDSLDGGAGADSMFGGLGDDAYYVDNAGDVTSEASALGGIDIVYSSINRQLTANVENLTLTGAAAIGYGNIIGNTIVGNAAANTLYGFEGNDRLDGGAGADTLFGASGDDTYVVDNANDVTVEGIAGPSGGIDTIESSIDRGLNANIENLTLTGTAAIGYGNVLDNLMTGNAAANSLFGFDGNDTLNGGAGADQMFGGNGNDTYYVDNAGDVTSETSVSGGIDTVISSVARTLTANIENLTLTGGANITGSGNALDNVIIGNAGDNTLYGLDGADTLDGGLGADFLQGGAGADTYVFSTALGGGNVDAIFGYNVADDTIQLNSAVFTGLSAGALAAGAFVVGATAADADDRIVYNSSTGQLYFDVDGNGAGAAVLFATLSPGLALTSADFIIGGP